jgi:hypothetical protein
MPAGMSAVLAWLVARRAWHWLIRSGLIRPDPVRSGPVRSGLMRRLTPVSGSVLVDPVAAEA